MRVLVVASDHVGSSMAGPGIRYLWFARGLAERGHAVTLVVPFQTDLVPDGFEPRVDNPWHASRMTPLARAHDAVVAQRLPVPTMLSLARSPTRAVYDLYAPLTIEHAALVHRQGRRGSQTEYGLNALTQRVALECGDAFVCAGETQRDLWIGALLAAGRIDPPRYASDPGLDELIRVVPFGIDPEPPQARRRVLKGVVPGIEPADTVLLWGGGIWNWFDPLTVIEALHRLDRPDVKLYFLGTRHPNAAVPEMRMAAEAVDLARRLELLDRRVFFNVGWVPYADRGAYLLEADVGVSAHFDELESRYAYRTRLLDYVWAGLPIVTTEGDSLGTLVRERGLGRTVAAGDVGAWTEALAAAIEPGERAARAAQLEAVRAELAWPKVVAELDRLLTARPPRAVRPQRTVLARYAVLRARNALETRGAAGIARRGLGGLRRLARHRRSTAPLPSGR